MLFKVGAAKLPSGNITLASPEVVRCLGSTFCSTTRNTREEIIMTNQLLRTMLTITCSMKMRKKTEKIEPEALLFVAAELEV